jgi:hypothetical protein
MDAEKLAQNNSPQGEFQPICARSRAQRQPREGRLAHF